MTLIGFRTLTVHPILDRTTISSSKFDNAVKNTNLFVLNILPLFPEIATSVVNP